MDLIVATRAEGGLVINPSTLTVNLRSKTYVGNIFQKVSIFLCYPGTIKIGIVQKISYFLFFKLANVFVGIHHMEHLSIAYTFS